MKTLRSIITLVTVIIVVGGGLYAAYKFTNLLDFFKRKPSPLRKPPTWWKK